jgi:hypothetical protein
MWLEADGQQCLLHWARDKSGHAPIEILKALALLKLGVEWEGEQSE